MHKKYAITIKKRTQPEWLCWLILILPFLVAPLIEWIGLPGAVRYTLDIVWFVLVVMMLCYRRFYNRATQIVFLWVCCFLLYTLLVYLVQFQSGLYYLWGFRNNFRFYAAFLAFAAFLTLDDIDDLWKLMDRLFWLNAAVSIFQFFFLDLRGDHLGGLFSTEASGNGFTNIFLLIIVTKSVVLYLTKQEKTRKCISKCLVALLIAALAELKFFYIEFLLVVALAVMFTNFTWRKFWLIIGSVIAVVAGALLLVYLFPNFSDFLFLERFYEAAVTSKGYTSSGDINRLTAIPIANEMWLKSFGQRLFGLGLGNCDTSSFAFLNTPFFQSYEDMHYTWLSYAMMYLECGWVGLMFYFGFFLLVWLRIHKIEKQMSGTAKSYCRIARIMAVLCCVIAIYNSSLRTEAGYMAYFVLAVPFALENQRRKKIAYV